MALRVARRIVFFTMVLVSLPYQTQATVVKTGRRQQTAPALCSQCSTNAVAIPVMRQVSLPSPGASYSCSAGPRGLEHLGTRKCVWKTLEDTCPRPDRRSTQGLRSSPLSSRLFPTSPPRHPRGYDQTIGRWPMMSPEA
eukprot:5833933-Prymnesium_polylepis.2